MSTKVLKGGTTMGRFILLALAFAAVHAFAEDKVAIKTKHGEGDAVDVRTCVKMKMSGTAQGQTISLKHESLEEYREKTLATKDGRPVRAERSYKTHEQTMEQKFGDMAAPGGTTKNEIVGQTVILLRKDDGAVALEAKPEAGELDEGDLDFATDDFDVFLPDEAVAVGEEWKVAPEKLAKAFSKGGPKATEATCRLEEVAERDGGRVARIAVKLTLKGEEAGTKISGELEGPFLFDLSSSRPLSMTMKGTVTVDSGMAVLEGPMEAEATFQSGK
jgi:hypothetical protein